ncbi:transglutaminase family protein [Novosphingobium sp. Gsoil 351]|uniref:transglutaminase family protein n=1 Tax=Novosphingobium sp. Gsoil 351 TaxID=2675225 RepID=UPI0012B48D23|nr:transglutaminase family protein [Novosphingobium sp. Gsoil 351]QGN54072.1 transglutaminase family protein [Novosphingobium sp. Gsoil 351]
MPTVSINHLTRYRYRQDVAFGEHRILLRPRESYDQRLLSAELEITPEPESLRWVQDVFGNAVAIANFSTLADQLEVRGSAEVEHLPIGPEQIKVEDYAERFPFHYSAEDLPDLQRSIERHYSDRRREVDEWARRFLPSGTPIRSLDLLRVITETIHEQFDYRRREEKGIQTPTETLATRCGTCRDFAMLMIEGVRALGLAARFVSGYLYDPDGRERVGGRSTHAWVRVFLPGSGWIEVDPTNGTIGNEGLIRVAVARDPIQALPLSGFWRGAADSPLNMTVDVRIKRLDLATRHPRFTAKEPA